ncbi:SLAC1 family transporter [Streptomyces sp. NPDC054796]
MATVLLVVAAPAWALVATAAVRAPRTHGLGALQQADGSWFLATVGLQSLVVALTATHQGPRAAVVAAALWCCGGLLYVATLAVLGHRLLRSPPGPQDLDPTYWITRGAAAITLLAGCQLPARVRSVDLDTALLGTWVWATLLIPVLLAAGVWRHLRRRVPLVYAPALWCVVFPTGMYAAATQRLGTVTSTAPLSWPLPPPPPSGVLVLCAVAAWLAVSALLVTRYRARPPAREPIRPWADPPMAEAPPTNPAEAPRRAPRGPSRGRPT